MRLVTTMARLTVFAALAAQPAMPAETQGFERALDLYGRTDYSAALTVLRKAPKTAEAHALEGKCWYYTGEFKRAVDAFERAVEADAGRSEYHHWLGRAWGRRAETSNMIQAPIFAGRARDAFERAVKLDGRNKEALNDLFEYYLQAPGFLGGGEDKAKGLLSSIQKADPAEYHYALAKLAEKRKEYDTAEGHLRRAFEAAPRQVGRALDLARFLARRGKQAESDAVFEQASNISAHDKRLYFAKAEVYVESKRNLEEARRLLNIYLTMPLVPGDPAKEEAERLLKRAGG